MGVVFIPFHFAEAAANLLTIDALDPQAKIPEYKACAVRVIPAKEEELPKPAAQQERGRW
jgi:predicted molibdopterin-dependent oxidoreductase YjgC